MSEMLFHRLDAEEHAARELVARLRAEIAEAEERLAELAITRRTAAQLLEEAPPGKPTASGGSAEGRDGGHTQSSTDGASESTESDAGSAPGGQPGTQQRRRADKQQGSQHSGRLTELNRKVVTLVGSADRPMSPKDVVIPLVDTSAPRAEIERMRHRLNRQVNKGYLKQVGPGLYTGAEVER
ncbi:hypothetical protein PV376_21175 [Streptomyces sp. NRRL_ISP-5395]|uniref:hypothetical protein n=1 Tax=Streptomyces TaxID=1883 RepID=UPI00187638F4|nr:MULTISPECIES: hypothetical protein [Streptomyces]MDX2672015.1 hypothetical protein [Streptomyces sp. NRRL_ISP-5395]GHF56954.1 hypothetical protein GCM10010504_26410 [Streptomyces griseus]